MLMVTYTDSSTSHQYHFHLLICCSFSFVLSFSLTDTLAGWDDSYIFLLCPLYSGHTINMVNLVICLIIFTYWNIPKHKMVIFQSVGDWYPQNVKWSILNIWTHFRKFYLVKYLLFYNIKAKCSPHPGIDINLYVLLLAILDKKENLVFTPFSIPGLRNICGLYPCRYADQLQ